MKKLLLFLASCFGIAAFVFMFVAPLQLIHKLTEATLNQGWETFYFGYASESIGGISLLSYNGTTLPFIGYILSILGGVAILLTLIFVNKSNIKNLIYLASGLLLIVGGVFIFFTHKTFVDLNEILVKSYDVKITFAPILAGIFSCVGGLTSWVSFIFKK
jgi:hypothetical protein